MSKFLSNVGNYRSIKAITRRISRFHCPDLLSLMFSINARAKEVVGGLSRPDFYWKSAYEKRLSIFLRNLLDEACFSVDDYDDEERETLISTSNVDKRPACN